MKISKRIRYLLIAAGVFFALLTVIIAVYATNLCTVNPNAQTLRNIPVIGKTSTGMQLQHVRHATGIVNAGGKKILIDPMLGAQGEESPYPLTANRVRNPLLPMPFDAAAVVKDVVAVILTHCHPDHFDTTAQKLLPKKTIIYCQPYDQVLLEQLGFTDVRVINSSTKFGTLSITRYDGNHAKGMLKTPMGPSSSYMLRAGSQSLFITGDALLDELLTASLKAEQPSTIVAFTGAAQFIIGSPITLGADDLYRITKLVPAAKIIGVHMNAINHCALTKDMLRSFAQKKNISDRILIPDEGDIIRL